MTDRIRWIVLAAWLAMAPAHGQEADPPAETGEEVTQGAPMASEDDERAAEDAAVDEVLSEAELIYRNEGEDGDFIPSEQVSADQSLDYPIDI